jgi:hypothetical protein
MLLGTFNPRAAVSREQEYRRLAEQAVATQETAQRPLGELNDRMADIQVRTAALERVLKEVE